MEGRVGVEMKIVVKSTSLLTPNKQNIEIEVLTIPYKLRDILDIVVSHGVDLARKNLKNKVIFFPAPLMSKEKINEINNALEGTYNKGSCVQSAIQGFEKGEFLVLVNGIQVSHVDLYLPVTEEMDLQFVQLVKIEGN